MDEARTIELYESPDGALRLDVRSDGETVWLTEVQMADLFGTTRQNVNLHLQNIYDEEEVDRESTRKDFLQVRQEGTRSVRRPVAHYNLDAVLKRYIRQGSAVNERRLAELGALTGILARSRDENVAGLADVLHRYTGDFDLLNAYDKGEFDISGGTEPAWNMNLADARGMVAAVRAQFPSDKMFGAERGPGFAGIIGVLRTVLVWNSE